MKAYEPTPPSLASLEKQGGMAAIMDPIRQFAPVELLKPAPLSTPAPAYTDRLPDGSQQPLTLTAWRLAPGVCQFLASALQLRWESYREQLRRCQQQFSEENVHELRVGTRRLSALLAMIEAATPGTKLLKLRRVLKRRLKVLGDLRDMHVQRLFVERRAIRFPELTLVWASLQRREHRLERSVAAKVKGFKTRKLERWISGVSARLSQDRTFLREPHRIAAALEQATAQAFAEVAGRRRAVDLKNPSTIHRTRIAFKKFRYMIESLSPDFTGLSKRDLRALARYQRRMGIIQDLEVMHRCVTDFLQDHAGMEELLRPFCRYLQASRARRLRAYLRSADDVYSFWPPSRVKSNGHVSSAALNAA